MCNQENKDKKRKKNEPPHKPEEYTPPQIMVTSKMLPEDEISLLAPRVLEELQKKYFEQLVDLFEDNCNRSRQFYSGFALLPSDESAEQIITQYRQNGGDSWKWLEGVVSVKDE